MTTERAEPYRIRWGEWATKPSTNYGAFSIPADDAKQMRVICAPTDELWQHVSVSLERRCPTWSEMNRIKDLFWEESEVVFQFHPAKKDYVNNHPFCLHLWRKQGQEIETPPIALIGVK